MNILYIGDIMGEPGIKAVENALKNIRVTYDLNLILAQAENLTDGKGISITDMKRLQKLGVDFLTGGNWSPHLSETHALLSDLNAPIIGPGNMVDCPGPGWKIIEKNGIKIAVISLLGQTVGRTIETTNPLIFMDETLEIEEVKQADYRIVNFHGDFSSEKRVIGYYLDGRVTAVLGDHWHVPTADAMILPKGTAHMTDVGMCGTLHSSLGVELDIIIDRWKNDTKVRNQLAEDGILQFNAALIRTEQNGLAKSIEPVQLATS